MKSKSSTSSIPWSAFNALRSMPIAVKDSSMVFFLSDAFQMCIRDRTNTAPESKCGSLPATTHRRAILPYSHSPSVKSVAGNGYGRVRTCLLYTSLLNVSAISTWGWLALAGILGNIVFYFFALLCSHVAAFGTLYELKVAFADHIMQIPLGYHLTLGSGKMRKIMDENIESVEKFIAHQLPDFVASLVAPLVLDVYKRQT